MIKKVDKNQEQEILKIPSQKLSYDKLVKSVTNRTGALENNLSQDDPNPNLKFFSDCIDRKLNPQPIFLKI
jgi:hypothetical protein